MSMKKKGKRQTTMSEESPPSAETRGWIVQPILWICDMFGEHEAAFSSSSETEDCGLSEGKSKCLVAPFSRHSCTGEGYSIPATCYSLWCASSQWGQIVAFVFIAESMLENHIG